MTAPIGTYASLKGSRNGGGRVPPLRVHAVRCTGGVRGECLSEYSLYAERIPVLVSVLLSKEAL